MSFKGFISLILDILAAFPPPVLVCLTIVLVFLVTIAIKRIFF